MPVEEMDTTDDLQPPVLERSVPLPVADMGPPILQLSVSKPIVSNSLSHSLSLSLSLSHAYTNRW